VRTKLSNCCPLWTFFVEATCQLRQAAHELLLLSFLLPVPLPPFSLSTLGRFTGSGRLGLDMCNLSRASMGGNQLKVYEGGAKACFQLENENLNYVDFS
jgi:hypothetical protein